MAAARLPALPVIVAAPTPVVESAALLPVAVPVTPAVLASWPLTKPVMLSLKVGLAAPYMRLWLSAVTVRCALLTVSVPFTRLVKS